MRASVTNNSGGFEVVELADPTPAPDQLVVAVTGCGVCGSDLKAQPFMALGTVMGHEFGGTVVAVGTEAKAAGWREGTTVAVLPVVSCGTCRWCGTGDVAHCSEARFLGMGRDPGGFAELVAVPATHAFALPEGMSSVLAPLVEPFAVGLHAIETGEVRRGDAVLVVGAGGVGLTTTAWAFGRGAGRVTVVDPDPARRAAAIAIGADDPLSSIEDAEAGAYDVVVECVGRPELVTSAAVAARARGRIVVAGACEQPVSVEPISALLKELSFRFSVAYTPADFRSVIEAFGNELIDPSSAVGATVPLSELGRAFELARDTAVDGRVLVLPT